MEFLITLVSMAAVLPCFIDSLTRAALGAPWPVSAARRRQILQWLLFICHGFHHEVDCLVTLPICADCSTLRMNLSVQCALRTTFFCSHRWSRCHNDTVLFLLLRLKCGTL
jgi:hypothetical protein